MQSSISTIGQVPVSNLRNYVLPEGDPYLSAPIVTILKEISDLQFPKTINQNDFNLSTQIRHIKAIEHRQDNTYSVREHRLKSLGYAAGTVFLVIIAGMTPKFPNMTKSYRIASAIITGLSVLASTTKAYAATKKWSEENLVKDGSYWIPLYNEIRYIYTAFLAKSGLTAAHENHIRKLNENLELCKTIEENWNTVEQALSNSDVQFVNNINEVIQLATHITEAAKKEAELKAAKEQK